MLRARGGASWRWAACFTGAGGVHGEYELIVEMEDGSGRLLARSRSLEVVEGEGG